MEKAKEAVLKDSDGTGVDLQTRVEGYRFEGEFSFDAYLSTLRQTGLQSSFLGKAVDIMRNMLRTKLELGSKMVTFLALSSNVGSSGMREAVAYLCRHRMVDVVVAAAGAVEEDVMKTLHPHFVADSAADPAVGKNDDDCFLREQGVNRIYNILVPNRNYVAFEAFMRPVLDSMVAAQRTGVRWTFSKMVAHMAAHMDGALRTDSFVWQCARNDIPVFSPALLDGSIGDMVYFHQNSVRELVVDAAADLCSLNSLPIFAERTGVLVLGGGLVKHHVLNANLMRNGCDFCVIVNAAVESDGSDASASEKEALTWGKIAPSAQRVKVFSEVSLVLPTLVAGSFKKFEKEFDAFWADQPADKQTPAGY